MSTESSLFRSLIEEHLDPLDPSATADAIMDALGFTERQRVVKAAITSWIITVARNGTAASEKAADVMLSDWPATREMVTAGGPPPKSFSELSLERLSRGRPAKGFSPQQLFRLFLASSVSIDGTNVRVAWGDMTVELLDRRDAYLAKKVNGINETRARGQKIRNVLANSGCVTLNACLSERPEELGPLLHQEELEPGQD